MAVVECKEIMEILVNFELDLSVEVAVEGLVGREVFEEEYLRLLDDAVEGMVVSAGFEREH